MVIRKRAFLFLQPRVRVCSCASAPVVCPSVRGRPAWLAGSSGGLGIWFSLVGLKEKQRSKAPAGINYPPLGLTHRLFVFCTGQPAPKTALKTSHKVLNKPAEFLGSDGPDCRERGSVMNRHESLWHVTNLRFWPAISEPGWWTRGHAEKEAPPLGVLVKSTRPMTRPSQVRVLRSLHRPEATQRNLLPGCRGFVLLF